VRRKPGTLIPIEQEILEAGLALGRRGEPSFHGFLIAKDIQQDTGAKRLTSHGTLYKALDRLERAGLLASQWEDPEEAAMQQRPRRRLYQVTAKGAQALAKYQVADRAAGSGRQALEGT
jgi:PadR family transcriptional regulator PadR